MTCHILYYQCLQIIFTFFGGFLIFYNRRSYEISVSRFVVPRFLPAVWQRCQSIPPTASRLPSKPGAFMSSNHWSVMLIPCSPVLNHQRAQIVWNLCLGKWAVGRTPRLPMPRWSVAQLLAKVSQQRTALFTARLYLEHINKTVGCTLFFWAWIVLRAYLKRWILHWSKRKMCTV